MPDGTKPVPEPILNYHQWSSVACISGEQFHSKCPSSSYYSLQWIWKLHFLNYWHTSQGPIIVNYKEKPKCDRPSHMTLCRRWIFHRRLMRYMCMCVASYMVHSSLFFVWWQELIWHQDICNHHCHDDVIRWKYFPRYWSFVRGIHWWPVNSPHKGQWRGPLKFSLICAWINGWVNNRKAGDLRRHRAHYDVIVM